MKRILLNTLFLIYSLASYAGDRLPREEPFFYRYNIRLTMCYINSAVHGIKRQK